MTQEKLNRVVARITGESLRFIKQRGFSLTSVCDQEVIDDDDRLPLVVDWDELMATQQHRLLDHIAIAQRTKD